MTLYLWQKPLNPDSATGQTCLSQAHKSGDRVECRCRVPAPPMYIAAIGGRFIVKRMPGTGPDHAIDCPCFLAPEELSGLAQIQASAITEDPDDGTTTLKLGFPLRKNCKGRTAPEQTGAKPTEAKAAPRKLTITSVLHFLWHEADLGKWYPRMEGKRFWGVIHNALRRAAEAKIVKGQDLARILYVPEFFKLEDKSQIAARRNRVFTNLRPAGRGATPFGFVIAEYKGKEITPNGARFIFKHAPDCAFFADEVLSKKFDKVFGDQLRFLEAMGSGHAILIASFSIAKAGYPVLHEIGMMLVTDNWIPFEGLRELNVLNALTEQSRAFQKQMRFNLPVDAPIASAVLLDTADPIALFVATTPDDAGALAPLTKAAEETRYASWCWFDDGPMRPFPDQGASPSSHRSRPPEGGATGQSVRPSPVNERRASGDQRDTMWDSPILPKGASDHG
ncbi:DUF1173 family protein [Ruegeria atlantica]|uniref:DUF1173 family protein n=1 Tax=Ruegeria atlantica TaxID=81569 RepID=UPI00147A77C4|nr:DUF1173 family protein [Ruegeria atlantica]